MLSVMLSISVLTNEVCIAWIHSFLMFASNGNTVWFCLVKNVSFISLGGAIHCGDMVTIVNAVNT